MIGRRCMVDTVGLYLAGSREHSVRILIDDALDQGGRPDAPLPGNGTRKVPAALAARVWGTAGHAHDWDDTQVSHDPAHVYGLLTHPSVPPLTAALIVASGSATWTAARSCSPSRSASRSNARSPNG